MESITQYPKNLAFFPIVCGVIEEIQAGLRMSFRLIVLEAVWHICLKEEWQK